MSRDTAQDKLVRVARRALRKLKKGKAGVDVYLVSDKVMKALNRKFRGKNRPTDVLSFPEPKKFPHPETKEKYLGEIYLALAYIRRTGGNPEALLIHGLLHLLGYTHKKRSDRIRMEKLEQKLYSHG